MVFIAECIIETARYVKLSNNHQLIVSSFGHPFTVRREYHIATH